MTFSWGFISGNISFGRAQLDTMLNAGQATLPRLISCLVLSDAKTEIWRPACENEHVSKKESTRVWDTPSPIMKKSVWTKKWLSLLESLQQNWATPSLALVSFEAWFDVSWKGQHGARWPPPSLFTRGNETERIKLAKKLKKQLSNFTTVDVDYTWTLSQWHDFVLYDFLPDGDTGYIQISCGDGTNMDTMDYLKASFMATWQPHNLLGSRFSLHWTFEIQWQRHDLRRWGHANSS